MIHLQFTQSPDTNVLSEFKYFKNELYIGRGSHDLSVNDPALAENHIMIEIPEEELLVHPQRDVTHYLLNGKRATAIRKLKAGDVLTIGSTTIKIVAFNRTQRPSKKEILNSRLAALIEGGSPRLSAIEKVSQLMK